MAIFFITGNKGKYNEAKELLPDLQELNIDLPEMQEVDPKKVIEAKLKEAFHHHGGEFIVEDTSIYLDAITGLPGPLTKWFLKTIGNDGLWHIADKLGNNGAEAKVVIGYAKSEGEAHFFEGALKGTIVAPRGSGGFGWDPIFEPQGFTKTFAEMTLEEKNAISMRKTAFTKLRNFLTPNA